MDLLSAQQQTEFDRVSIEDRLRPSGDQTPAQARAFAVSSFRRACEFDGIDVPSDEAVEAAIDAAQAAAKTGRRRAMRRRRR